MSAPFPLPNLIAIFRPFGATTPVYADVPCRIVPNRFGSRYGPSSATLRWDHWLDCESSVDIRDGTERVPFSNWNDYNDGDMVSTVIGGVYFCWLVAWVEVRYSDTPREYKRAYLVRECANWAPVPPS